MRSSMFPKARAKIIPPIPLERCLAKTWLTEDGIRAGRTVEEHCRIAMHIAIELLARISATWQELPRIISNNAYLAPGLHDIGKITPTFQKKIYSALGAVPEELLEADASADTNHASVSYAALEAAGAGKVMMECAGRHHGRPPKILPEGCGNYGGAEWAFQRANMIRILRDDMGFPEAQSEHIIKAIGGLTILCDWIASGPIFDDPSKPCLPLIPKALNEAGFCWPTVATDLAFRDLFGFEPNDIQRNFIEAVVGPGLYILEAPMGTGKTEAALYAAYKLLSAHKASGIYFGLPTQLTSNRMYDRVNNFLARIFPEEKIRSTLAHSEMWLKHFLDHIESPDETPANAWFEHGKRAILAPFAVGTVDQALLAATRARWSALRLFGLTGKVVIIDEAHSYDAYTGELLDILVERLLAVGSTVIILSATLTSARRKSFILRSGIKPEPATSPLPYPLITAAAMGPAPSSIVPLAPESCEIQIALTDDERACIEEALSRAEQGQQIIWIENTVDKAQAIFKYLSARASGLGIESGLIHSRFTSGDRAANEAYWTNILGKPGTPGAESRSACGRILVGTQVLEQSLDIDADFMISRFAPTDLLFQRAGRLWRHTRSDRPATAMREMWIIAPTLEKALAEPKKAFEESGTAYVYDPYTLARSLEIWSNVASLRLPEDIRPMLEQSHLYRHEALGSPMAMAQKHIAEIIRVKIGIAQDKSKEKGATDSSEDDFISTRLTDMETVKVLLLKSLDPETGQCALPDGTRLDLLPKPNGRKRNSLAAQLAMHTVKIAATKAPEPVSGAFATILAPYFYEAGANKLRVVIIGPDGSARTLHGIPLPEISYDERIGYHYE